MRFLPSFLDDIRARVPISEVIGRRVTWDRRKSQPGRGDWWACCPFHGEKSPSFHCEDQKGRYHCFGCGVSGDHFRFLVECEGVSFPEAVERLAAEAGLALPARDPEAEKREEARATILDALRLARGFFAGVLQEADGAKARSYLRDRGLTPETQKTFDLGYAPEGRSRLKEFLAAKGVGRTEIEAAGLVVHGEGIAVSYDRFRDRVMFPIEDAQERTIAFGGRALSANAQAKYLNSPETEVFGKGGVLFNLARARRAARTSQALILVEGYVDVIALHQAGFAHAVAPLGTALTDRQLDLAWRTVPEPVLCFDGDPAGIKAAHRAADLALPLLKPGRSLRFALLPAGKDPDDLVREGGADAFATVLEAARPLADLLWTRETTSGVFDTPERRAELEQRVKTLARSIGDESVRRHYLQDMDARLRGFFGQRPAGAQRTGGFNRGGEGRREGGFGGGKRGPGGRPEGPPDRAPSAPPQQRMVSDRLGRSALLRKAPAPSAAMLRETAIVLGFVHHPALLSEGFDYFADLELAEGRLERLRSAVLDAYAEDPPQTREDLVDRLRAAGLGPVYEEGRDALRRLRLWPFLEEAAPEDARDAVRQALLLHHRARALTNELRSAEESLGRDFSESTYLQIVEVKREIDALHGTEALIEGFGVLSGRGAKTY